MNLMNISKALIISPHPDDETLGVGGTISKLIDNGIQINVLIVSGHLPPLYEQDVFEKTKNELYDAMTVLGVPRKNIEFLNIPATFVNVEPVSSLNSKISSYISSVSPEMVFIPFPDRHVDHRVIFDSCMVATRPLGINRLKVILAYETLSETHWNANYIEPNFVPDFYFDISNDISKKINALSKFNSQILENSSRSLNAVECLAKFRGSQNGCDFAEAFKLIRCVV